MMKILRWEGIEMVLIMGVVLPLIQTGKVWIYWMLGDKRTMAMHRRECRKVQAHPFYLITIRNQKRRIVFIGIWHYVPSC